MKPSDQSSLDVNLFFSFYYNSEPILVKHFVNKENLSIWKSNYPRIKSSLVYRYWIFWIKIERYFLSDKVLMRGSSLTSFSSFSRAFITWSEGTERSWLMWNLLTDEVRDKRPASSFFGKSFSTCHYSLTSKTNLCFKKYFFYLLYL